MFNHLALPPYESVKQFEGKGNFAIDKYYKMPYSFFYRHKLKMIKSLMGKNLYKNCLDFGSGPGIFTPELKKHAYSVYNHDLEKPVDLRWKFELIVCSSVLEFCDLNTTLSFLRSVCKNNGTLIVASPMNTPLSRFYFNLIKDGNARYSHIAIISAVSKYFKIEKKKEFLGLYFALKAVKK